MNPYKRLEANLEKSDDLVRILLVVIALLAIFLVFQPSRTARLVAVLWWILP